MPVFYSHMEYIYDCFAFGAFLRFLDTASIHYHCVEKC